MNKLSIIIITLNEEDYILSILQDLKQQSWQNFEIIVSDSNSSDNTEKITRTMKNQFNEFRFVNCGKTLGPSYGRNFGVKFAKYERLLFLDADIRLHDKHFLEKFMKIATKMKLDAGSMYTKPETKKLLWILSYKLLNFGLFISQYFSPTACGGSLFSTKTMHEKIGGFKEDVCLSEDCDYVRDGKKNGFTIKMIPLYFKFSIRRIQKDGLIKTQLKYLFANIFRLLTGKSIQNDQIKYDFGHYSKKF